MIRVVTLRHQFRMHPVLGKFVSDVFYKPHDEGFHSPLPAGDFAHDITGYLRAGRPVCAAWRDIPRREGEERQGRSKARTPEARWIAKELRRLLVDVGANATIGVISFYRAQVDEILESLVLERLAERDPDSETIKIAPEWRILEREDGSREERLRVGTVDAFQGKEFDAVFLSVTRSNAWSAATEEERRRKFGHLMLENRLCVAMSRQRRLLVAVGDKAISVSVHAEEPLKFVSLPAMLEAGVNVGEWIATVREPSVVVAALPADEPRAPAEARLRLRSLSHGPRGAPIFVAVAPWDLESVERVARTLRSYAWSALFARYPLAVELPVGWAPPVSMPPWVRIADRSLYVIKPRAAHERAWTELDARIDAAALSLADARSRLDACEPHDKRRRLRLKHELEGATGGYDAARKVGDAVEVALATIELLRRCPVCGTASNTHDFEHTNKLFRSQCSECGAAWGRRTCRACQEPFPFLDFPGNSPSEDLLGADRRYGADVLAIPLANEVYLCPNCGNRTDSGPPNLQDTVK